MGGNWRDQFGEHAELYVCEKLKDLGFEVEHIGKSYEYDILIEGKVRAEVKGAAPTNGSNGNINRWQFSFGRHNGKNDEEIVFLVCYDKNTEPVGVFVIPGCEVEPELKKIDITSKPDEYGGKWAAWFEAWDGVKTEVLRVNVKPELSREKTPSQPIPF